ncbi:MAG: 30S ribosomal protein S6 [Candidatus Shapirobacteria bacterium]
MTTEKRGEYELVLVFPAELTKAKLTSLKKQIKEVVKEAGGEIGKIADWGLKPLAYPLKKKLEANFFIYQINFSQAPVLAKINIFLNRNSQILRYLWIKQNCFKTERRKNG